MQAMKNSTEVEVQDNIKIRTCHKPGQWPLSDIKITTELHPDVPAFIPGQPYVLHHDQSKYNLAYLVIHTVNLG